MRWAQRATSLGPKPSFYVSSFLLFCFCFCSPFFVLNRKSLFSPEKRQLVFICLCFPLFLFSLFWASPFLPFLFLCLSLSLYLSLSLSLVLFFRPSFQFFSMFCFWFLLFLFVLFASWLKMLFSFFFFFFCLLSCFVLNHHVWYIFALHLVFLLLFFVFVALVFCNFFIFGNLSKTSLNILEIAKEKQKWKMQKKRTLGQEQLAQVCSQIVSFFFSFLCFFKFCIFCRKHYKNSGFSPKEEKQHKKQKS